MSEQKTTPEEQQDRGHPSADSEHTQKAASSAIRKGYIEELHDQMKQFADRANLADVMLLHELLQNWRAVAVPHSDHTFLGGAMAELLGLEIGDEQEVAAHA